jgi:glycosyltransferase involved in cell wall biosynthesis
MKAGHVLGQDTKTSDALSRIAVLIPAWQPDKRLSDLVCQLLELGFGAVIVVDDGSDSLHKVIFETVREQGCQQKGTPVKVITHPINLGKGRALKTGLEFFLEHYPEYIGVVTADADGQHSSEGVLNVARQMSRDQACLVVGSRSASGGTPVRSLVGNLITRHVFVALTGTNLNDTQSGLRGIPSTVIPHILDLEGERYEYEMNVLISATDLVRIVEVPIETIYFDGNRSSHFDPFRDSIRIYSVLGRFLASSLIAAGIDYCCDRVNSWR